MAAVALMSNERAPSSAIAFAHDLPFLAAGTPPGAATGARLSIFGAAGPAPDVRLDNIVASYPSPAGFCSLAWSKPTDTDCSLSPSAGLIAGGLESGAVAIWDPRSQLRHARARLPAVSPFLPQPRPQCRMEARVIDDYFSPEGRRKPPQNITNPNLLAAGSSNASHGAVLVWDPPPNLPDVKNFVWESGYEVIEMEDYFSSERPRKPPCSDTTNAGAGSSDTDAVLAWDWPPNDLRNLVLSNSSEGGHHFGLNCSPSRLDAPADMVALFSNHLGPVRGLSFGSSSQINLLASSTPHGRILIYDLGSGQSIPALQCYGFDTSEISSLSWSPNLTNVIASTSLDGTSIWDISAKSPLIWNFQSNRKFSAVEWSPTDPNVLIVASDDCNNPTSLLIFDRRMEKPIKEFCEESGGVVSISWCPYQDRLIIACRNKKIIVWSMKKQQPLWQGSGLDDTHFTHVHWSKTSTGVFAATTGESISLYSVEDDGSQDH